MKARREAGILCVVLFAVYVLSGPAAGSQPLTVTGGEPVIYACANGDRLVARYYSLSDDSLRFVKILFPDGREYTLPQVISGSGARYRRWELPGGSRRRGQGEIRTKRGMEGLSGECRAPPEENPEEERRTGPYRDPSIFSRVRPRRIPRQRCRGSTLVRPDAEPMRSKNQRQQRGS